MTQGAGHSGSAPADLRELRARLREAEARGDEEQAQRLRRELSDAADRARLERQHR